MPPTAISVNLYGWLLGGVIEEVVHRTAMGVTPQQRPLPGPVKPLHRVFYNALEIKPNIHQTLNIPVSQYMQQRE